MTFRPRFESQQFKYISIDKFVKKQKEIEPQTDVEELKKNLIYFRQLKNKGEKCNCGNPIWTVGSAISGKSCFTCLTGEADSSNDFEVA